MKASCVVLILAAVGVCLIATQAKAGVDVKLTASGGHCTVGCVVFADPGTVISFSVTSKHTDPPKTRKEYRVTPLGKVQDPDPIEDVVAGPLEDREIVNVTVAYWYFLEDLDEEGNVLRSDVASFSGDASLTVLSSKCYWLIDGINGTTTSKAKGSDKSPAKGAGPHLLNILGGNDASDAVCFASWKRNCGAQCKPNPFATEACQKTVVAKANWDMGKLVFGIDKSPNMNVNAHAMGSVGTALSAEITTPPAGTKRFSQENTRLTDKDAVIVKANSDASVSGNGLFGKKGYITLSAQGISIPSIK